MEKKPIDKFLIDTTEYLKSIGLETFLVHSTLLHIVRSRRLKIKTQYDREINLGCRFEDFTDEMFERIEKDFKKVEKHGWYFLFGNQKETFWEGKGSYFTFLSRYKKVGNNRWANMGLGNYLKWPAYHFDKLEKITYRGYEFKVPSDRKKWLETYFSEGWKKEDLTWNWGRAENLRQITDERELESG